MRSRYSLFLLARRRQLTGSHRSTRSARSDAVNPVVQRAVHTSAPTRTTVHQGNAIASTPVLQPQQVQTRDEIPIAPATTSVRNRPRFRALALFGRRPQQRMDRPSSRQPKTLFSFNPISLLDLRAHFFTPTRQLPNDVARRGCQGWPPLRFLLMPRRCQATP